MSSMYTYYITHACIDIEYVFEQLLVWAKSLGRGERYANFVGMTLCIVLGLDRVLDSEESFESRERVTHIP